jgi:hypothetical protein
MIKNDAYSHQYKRFFHSFMQFYVMHLMLLVFIGNVVMSLTSHRLISCSYRFSPWYQRKTVKQITNNYVPIFCRNKEMNETYLLTKKFVKHKTFKKNIYVIRYIPIHWKTNLFLIKKNSDSSKQFSETDIIKMLEFVIAMFLGCTFRQTVGILIGINCVHYIRELFL